VPGRRSTDPGASRPRTETVKCSDAASPIRALTAGASSSLTAAPAPSSNSILGGLAQLEPAIEIQQAARANFNEYSNREAMEFLMMEGNPRLSIDAQFIAEAVQPGD